MNYQLLIESYSFGSALSEQEIELLSLGLETNHEHQYINRIWMF